jgi:hypothetical protein
MFAEIGSISKAPLIKGGKAVIGKCIFSIASFQDFFEISGFFPMY